MDTVSTDRSDRRESARHPSPAALGIISARVRPGHDVALVDLSPGGALIESSHRLLPGRVVELSLQTAARRINVSGQVLRCTVSAVHPARMSYRGALRFERHLRGVLDEPPGGNVVPHTDPLRGTHLGAD